MLCQQLLALASTESSGETEKFQTGGKPSADQAYSDQAANTALVFAAKGFPTIRVEYQ